MPQHEPAQWHVVTRTRLAIDPDRQRTASAAIASHLKNTTMLLVRHGNEPVTQYLYGRTSSLRKAGIDAGFEVSPLADDNWPDLPETATCQAHPIVPWTARLNEVGNMERLRADTEAIRSTLESSMPADSYIAITMRPAGRWEQSRVRDWVADEHNAVEDTSTLVRGATQYARISVGAQDMGEARDMAEQAGRTVFDSMSNMSAHASRPRLGALLTSVTVALAWTLVALASPLDIRALFIPLAVLFAGLMYSCGVALAAQADILPQVVGVSLAVGVFAVAGLWSWPLWTMLIPWAVAFACLVRWLRRSLWDDITAVPRHYRWLAPKRVMRSADRKTKLGGDDDGPAKRVQAHAYPTQRSTLIIPPASLTAIYTPIGDAAAKSQQLRPVPDVLASEGIFLGHDQSGRRCYLQPEQLYGCVAVTGEAGSGKSVMVHGIMQWADLHRASSDPNIWGSDSRIIDIEMKDDTGIRTMDAFRAKHGLPAGGTSYLADPHYACVDLLGMLDGKDARSTGQAIAANMRASFNPGDIMNDSMDVITSGMTVAVAASRYDQQHPGDILERMGWLEQKYPGAASAVQPVSPVGWCLLALAGADGQTGAARALGQVIRGLSQEHADSVDLAQAARAAEQLYGRPDAKGHATVSEAQLRANTKASVNKVRQLTDVESVFTARRARITWRQVLASPGDYHFVLAPHGQYRIPQPMDKVLGAWMLKRLCDTIMSECQGWAAQGKHTMIVCDELSMLCAADDSSLTRIKDQMRSFGVVAVFATQYPEQLTEQLLRSFMGYATLIAFKTPDPATAGQIAARLSDEDGADGWNAGAVMNLMQYQCAVRTQGAAPGCPVQLQPAFLVSAHDFDGEPL